MFYPPSPPPLFCLSFWGGEGDERTRRGERESFKREQIKGREAVVVAFGEEGGANMHT